MTSLTLPLNGESPSSHQSSSSGQLPKILAEDECLLLQSQTPSSPTAQNNNNHFEQKLIPARKASDELIISKGSNGKKDKGCFGGRGGVRYFILILTVTCLTFTRSNELSFNFNVICMTSNATNHIEHSVEISPDEISTIMAAGGFGALLFVLPIVQLIHHAGVRVVFGSLLMISGIATIALGPLAHLSPLWMLPGRIIQGLALSTVMPMTGAVSAEWAPLTEMGKFVTALSAAGQISQILTMPLSAYLCETSGWSSVYTTHGCLSIAAAIMFFIFYRNSISDHPFITTKEIGIISQGAKKAPVRGKVPYLQIAKSKPVWAVWIAFFGNAIGFQLIVQFMPTFLNKVMKVGVRQTGLFAIIPPITQLIVKLAAGYASDSIKLPEIFKLRCFNTLAQLGCAICLLPLGFITSPKDSGIFAVICFTCSISFLGLVSCGSMKSAALIGRGYTHFIMAIVQFIVCISMLYVPFLVSTIAPDNTIEQWRLVFISVFVVLSLTNAVFCILCSSEPQPWAITQSPPKKDPA
jgi:MFS family permease